MPRQLRADHALRTRGIAIAWRIKRFPLDKLSKRLCSHIVGDFAVFPVRIHRAPVEQTAAVLCALSEAKRQKRFDFAGNAGVLRGRLTEAELEMLREERSIHDDWLDFLIARGK